LISPRGFLVLLDKLLFFVLLAVSAHSRVWPVSQLIVKNIHPLSSAYLRFGCRCNRFQERNLDIPLPSDTLQLVLEDLEVFPGSMEYIIPPVSSGSALGLLPAGDMPGKTPKGDDQEAS